MVRRLKHGITFSFENQPLLCYQRLYMALGNLPKLIHVMIWLMFWMGSAGLIRFCCLLAISKEEKKGNTV